MRYYVPLALIVLVVSMSCPNAAPGQEKQPAISIERLRADVKYLASDQLQGRGIGTRGEQLAVGHIAVQFEQAWLKPAGEGGTFFQRVPLVMVTTGPKATLAMIKGDQTTNFKLEDEFAGVSKTQASEDFDAEAIFLGHGITAPEFGWDDYKDVDVKGKVVVVFTNEPPSDDPKFFGGKALTYYGRWSYKYEEATRRGAKAVLIIHTNETAGYPYSVVRKLTGAQLQRPAGSPALAFAGWLSTRAGDKLLASVGLTVDEALKKADTRGFKAIPLGIRIKGHIPTTVRKIVTRNVIGMVEGSDAALKSEAVLFTAHWDHLGVVKSAVGTDDIYNGARDNATGCSILLEMARLWASQDPRPKRSALFLATTAEENGLLGAYHYAAHPALPLGKTALNLNFDTLLPLGVPESVVVSGAERTTAWPMVQEIARRHKLEIEPDKNAHLGFFYRSDHFALARGGVPAFSVFPGEKIKGKPADYARKAMAEYIAKLYHSPFDEYRDDWDVTGYPAIMQFAFDVAREAANAKTLPTWAPGDEFRKAREMSGVKATRDVPAAQPDPKERARRVAQILDKHYAVDSKTLGERTYAGFTLGEAKDKQPAKKAYALHFDQDKLVGFVREHRTKVNPLLGNELDLRFADLEKELGKANPERSWDFDFVDQRSSARIKTRLIRYTFPKMVAYGSYSQHAMWISVHDREHLLGVLRRDLEKKLEILESCKPVAALVKADAIDWKKIPFPEVAGCKQIVSPNYRVEAFAYLQGRPGCNFNNPFASSAVFVHEITRDGARTVTVAIAFNSFPTYDPHPLLGPTLQNMSYWTRSEGDRGTAQETPLLNVPLVADVFGLGDLQPKRKVVENRILGGGSQSPCYTFTWETADGTNIEIGTNNMIKLTRKTRQKK